MALLSQASIVQAPQPAPITQTAPKEIEYVPLAREAQRRQHDTTLTSFRMTKGSYDTAYGSTDDGWRDVRIGRRFVLPEGCAPRRSKRFM